MGDVEMATFPDLVAAGQDETVILAFIVYRSRAQSDEVNAVVMEEMETDAGGRRNRDAVRRGQDGLWRL